MTDAPPPSQSARHQYVEDSASNPASDPGTRPQRILGRLRDRLADLGRDVSGNVMMVVGLSILPMTFAVGFGIDYSRAMRLETKLNAAADAASLAGVSAMMMQKSDAEATAAARAMFNKQVAGLEGLIYTASNTNPTITVTSTTGVNTERTVVVTFSARSTNAFSSILGSESLPISGTATGYATRAPHINFYLVMDTSPSMLLPTTAAGLNRMRALTTSGSMANGCAFACHVQRPHDDNIYIRSPGGKDVFLANNGTAYVVEELKDYSEDGKTVKYVMYLNASNVKTKGPKFSDGYYADSLWAAKNYDTMFPPAAGFTGASTPLELRLDAEQLAAQDLIPFAQRTAADNRVTYRMQMYSFGYGSPTELTSSLSNVNDLTSASIPNLMNQQAYWYKNNCITQSNCINDQATEFKTMFNYMNSEIPNPGTGASADDPQAVMFLITDGMSDESLSGSRNNRELRQSHLDQCTAIKNKGIRIAILYTKYLPESLTGDSWSQGAVAPYLNNVEPALRSCASAKADGTPLMYTVTSDDNIPQALNALFSLTVSSAHLTR